MMVPVRHGGKRLVRLAVVCPLLVAAGVASARLVIRAATASHPCSREDQSPNLRLADARRFHRFDLFYAGSRVVRLRMSSVTCYQQAAIYKPSPSPHYFTAPSWDFTYGTCQPAGSEGGCTDPVEIQENDSCWDNPRLSTKKARRLQRVRGVPSSASVDSGDGFSELVLYTRSSTLTIDAPNLRQARKIALSLRGLNAPYATRASLPAPSARTLAGKTKCRDLQRHPGAP